MLRLHVLAPARQRVAVSAANQEEPSRKLARFLSYMRAKDDIHEAYLRANFFLCKMLQEVNTRLQLPANDIFNSSWRSLADWLQGSTSETKLRHEIEINKYIRESMRCWQRPSFIARGMPGFASDSFAPAAKDEPSAEGGGVRLFQGIGGSPGIATGTCRVCSTLDEAVAVLQQGDVLVTEVNVSLFLGFVVVV